MTAANKRASITIFVLLFLYIAFIAIDFLVEGTKNVGIAARYGGFVAFFLVWCGLAVRRGRFRLALLFLALWGGITIMTPTVIALTEPDSHAPAWLVPALVVLAVWYLLTLLCVLAAYFVAPEAEDEA